MILAFALIFARQASAPSTNKPVAPASQLPSESGFNKQLHSIEKPGSIWWLVSKVRPISPIDYAPDDLVTPSIPLRSSVGSGEMRLRKEASDNLEEMIKDAKKINIDLLLVSGYRSYQTQVSVYNGWVQTYGQSGADKVSARPGTSEHQTGLAVDLGAITRSCELEVCFADLPEGKWLGTNAHRYGFIVRYRAGKESVTGYQYEPWHLRYVGEDLAAEMHSQNIQTLEEFFGVVPDKQPY